MDFLPGPLYNSFVYSNRRIGGGCPKDPKVMSGRAFPQHRRLKKLNAWVLLSLAVVLLVGSNVLPAETHCSNHINSFIAPTTVPDCAVTPAQKSRSATLFFDAFVALIPATAALCARCPLALPTARTEASSSFFSLTGLLLALPRPPPHHATL